MSQLIQPSLIASPPSPAGEAANAPAPVMAGRPTHYTAETAQCILDELLAGRPLDAVCRDDGMPPRSTVRQWVADDREGFAARYREARKRGKTELLPGRPPVYTAACAERILAQLSAGRTLADICGEADMPVPGTVWQWVVADADDFAARYRRARATGRAKMGRQTLYTKDIADWILDQLAEGRTLADICRDHGMPARPTVQAWVDQDREGFAARYKTARDSGCHAMGDQMIDISQVEGRVKASSIRKIGEIVEKHPEEAVSIVRNWMYQDS